MSPVRPRFQVDASTELIAHAKVMAYSKNMSNLTQYVLMLLAQDGDDKMKELVAKEPGGRALIIPPKTTKE